MPELSHDTAEDGFHEIQLSGKQLVFLFMTVTIVSVFIFLCGVLVGRGAREARLEDGAAGAQASAAQAPAPAEATPPAAEPPAPAETPEELTYHRTLQGEGAPAENLKKKPEEPAAATPPAPVPAPPPQPRAEEPLDVPTSGRAGALVVQVFASQDRAVAAELVKKLGGKGYPAFLVAPASRTTPRMYKVQVGRYNDRREAESVMRRLEKEEQFKPWITSR